MSSLGQLCSGMQQEILRGDVGRINGLAYEVETLAESINDRLFGAEPQVACSTEPEHDNVNDILHQAIGRLESAIKRLSITRDKI